MSIVGKKLLYFTGWLVFLYVAGIATAAATQGWLFVDALGLGAAVGGALIINKSVT